MSLIEDLKSIPRSFLYPDILVYFYLSICSVLFLLTGGLLLRLVILSSLLQSIPILHKILNNNTSL